MPSIGASSFLHLALSSLHGLLLGITSSMTATLVYAYTEALWTLIVDAMKYEVGAGEVAEVYCVAGGVRYVPDYVDQLAEDGAGRCVRAHDDDGVRCQ